MKIIVIFIAKLKTYMEIFNGQNLLTFAEWFKTDENYEKYHPKLIDHLTQFTLICNTNDSKLGDEMAEMCLCPSQVATSIEVGYASKSQK